MWLETIDCSAVNAAIRKWVPFVNNSVTEDKLSNAKATPSFEKFFLNVLVCNLQSQKQLSDIYATDNLKCFN